MVPAEEAQNALERLLATGVVDQRRGVAQKGDRVLIPVERAPSELEDQWTLETATLGPNPRRPPLDRIREALTTELAAGLLDLLPRGWSELGDVVVLRLPEELLAHAEAIGAAFGEVLGVRSVISLEESRGELREPVTHHLWGDVDTETVHRENGIAYHLDPARVMFSPGNHHERHRLAETITPGEHVVDLFAGIGYFALPLARAGARVTACEKNPVAAGFLERSAEANGLADRIEVLVGDCRERAPEGSADRVHMGYFPATWRYLDCALRALRADGGMLHYHTEVKEPDAIQKAKEELVANLPSSAPQPRTVGARRVKTTGPGAVHVVLDVEVTP